MILRGILDFSLGGFLCLRGYASLGALHDISDADPGFQRETKAGSTERLIAFLRSPDSLFFPEVILSANLDPTEESTASIDRFVADLRADAKPSSLKISGLRISYQRTRYKSDERDKRAVGYLRRARLLLPKKSALRLSRVDGNHRLSVVSKDPAFREINAPFCLVLFRSAKEAARNSRVLFHNINYKQQPLSMEENLRLILDDEHSIFADEDLKKDPPFGWPFYLARQLHRKSLDLDLLPHLRSLIESEPRTFLVETLTALHADGLLKDNERAIGLFKGAMQRAHALFESHPALSTAINPGLLSALVHYELKGAPKAGVFVRWVLANHLHKIARSDAGELIKIFDQVLLSRGRKIFVSMPFGKDETDDHWDTIIRVCAEVSKEVPLDPPLKPERVDWFKDGTSYAITEKILEMISGCGLLIGDLTHGNANVYHEIGYLMGQSHAKGESTARLLLILDQAVKPEARKVSFNLQGLRQLRFKGSEAFGKQLRKELETFFCG
jgi:hypothetical protein